MYMSGPDWEATHRGRSYASERPRCGNRSRAAPPARGRVTAGGGLVLQHRGRGRGRVLLRDVGTEQPHSGCLKMRDEIVDADTCLLENATQRTSREFIVQRHHAA